MARKSPIPEMNDAADDFQRAAAAAVAEIGKNRWLALTPREQTQAIYEQLQRIDGRRVVETSYVPGPHGRFRVAGESARETD